MNSIVPLLLLPVFAFGSELQYFDQKIDFWGENQPKTEKVVQPTISPEKDVKSEFPWKTYLDPKNREFFKEGDYTPPEPFMEVAKDPSDENIKNWLQFIKTKNDVAARLESRMQEYMAKEAQPALATQIAARVAKNETKMASAPLDPARFRIRMYFDSHCPHCRRMFAVLKRLQSEGYAVEVLQVDRGPLPQEETDVPRGQADLAELKSHGGTAVPFLVVADMKRKALLPGVQGYHGYNEVIALLREASRS